MSRDPPLKPTRRNGIELLTLFTIPAVLGAIYYLTPFSFQQQLVLDHTNPHLHTFWTNALVHEHSPSDGHLTGNIIAYMLVVIPSWILYSAREQKRTFWNGLAILLTVGPIIISASSYVAFHEILDLAIENDRGFSGVVGGISGFLIMSILRAFTAEQDDMLALLSMGIFTGYLMLGLGALTSRPPLMAFGGLIFVIIGIGVRTGYVAHPERLSNWGAAHPSLSKILVFATLVSTFALAASLPADLISASGGLKNIVAHGAGILFGMAVEISLRYPGLPSIRRAIQTSGR